MSGPIVFLGDSITLGVRPGVIASDTFAYKIAAARNAAYVNAGVAGDTTRGMRGRFYADVLVHSPSWVCLMTENDAYPPVIPLVESEDNLRTMIELSLRAGADFTLMTPPLVRNPDGNSNVSIEMSLLTSYLTLQRRVIRDYRAAFVDVSAMLEEAGYYGGLVLGDLLLDDWHLNPAGHTWVANLLTAPQYRAVFTCAAAPGWRTIFGPGTSNGDSAGWTGYTSRTRFETPTQAVAGASRIRVTLKAGSAGAHPGEVWAGPASSSGFGFSSAPTQLSAGLAIAANATAVLDVPFAWQQAPLVISAFEAGPGGSWTRVPALAGASSAWKSGNGASDVSATGYAGSSDASDLIVMVEAFF